MTCPRMLWTTDNPFGIHSCQFRHPCVLILNCALALAIYIFAGLILILWHRETHINTQRNGLIIVFIYWTIRFCRRIVCFFLPWSITIHESSIVTSPHGAVCIIRVISGYQTTWKPCVWSDISQNSKCVLINTETHIMPRTMDVYWNMHLKIFYSIVAFPSCSLNTRGETHGMWIIKWVSECVSLSASMGGVSEWANARMNMCKGEWFSDGMSECLCDRVGYWDETSVSEQLSKCVRGLESWCRWVNGWDIVSECVWVWVNERPTNTQTVRQTGRNKGADWLTDKQNGRTGRQKLWGW